MKTKVLLGIYIGILVGLALASVGEPIACTKQTYNYWLPINVFLMLLTPALLGYIIGRDDENKEDRYFL